MPTPNAVGWSPHTAELGGVLQRLAEVSLKVGNREEAVQAYRKLEALWREADPALVKVADTLRQRLLASGLAI